MKQHKWVIDVLLVIIIGVMGFFVVRQINRMIDAREVQEQEATPEAAVSLPEDADESAVPTETVVEQPPDLPAPDFSLQSVDGDMVSLSDFHGTPVMINFWASWCPPCKAEMPLIQTFADQHAGELVVLAVNSGEEEGVVKQFMEENSLDLIVLLDQEHAAAERYQLRGLPTSYFIDAEGLLKAIHIGELDERLLTAYLEEIGVSE